MYGDVLYDVRCGGGGEGTVVKKDEGDGGEKSNVGMPRKGGRRAIGWPIGDD